MTDFDNITTKPVTITEGFNIETSLSVGETHQIHHPAISRRVTCVRSDTL
jgi:hypothetical protein